MLPPKVHSNVLIFSNLSNMRNKTDERVLFHSSTASVLIKIYTRELGEVSGKISGNIKVVRDFKDNTLST